MTPRVSGEAPALMGPSGAPLPPAMRSAARAQMARNRLMASTAYQGAGYDNPSLAKWRPRTWSGHSALRWDRESLVDRLNDVARNDGWASAGVTRLVDNIIGSGWILSAKPNYASLNLSYDEAEEIADRIEALWRDYTLDVDMWCDAERSKNMAGILGLAARHRFGADGEAMAILIWRDDAPGFQTAVQVVDPGRCSNPMGRMDDKTLRDGVEIDDHGAAVAYHFRRAHPGDVFMGMPNQWQWDRVERETEWGRPIVVHAFEAARAGMTRGASNWAPVIRSIKQATDYEDFETQAALLNAVMAAFIETPFDPDELMDSLGADGTSAVGSMYGALAEAQQAYYDAAPINLPGVRVNTLQPGETAKFTRPEHPNVNFEAFVNAALRKIASAVGLSYEQLTMDWSKVNYSSARAALLEVWKGLTSRKNNFAAQFMGRIYRAFLEEMFDKRLIVLPAHAVPFDHNPAAWCHAEWIGPGRGWIDPQREAQAAGIRISSNLSTLQQEAAEQGRDWKVNALQRKRERDFYTKLGLDPDSAQPETRTQSKTVTETKETDDEIEEEVNGQRSEARRHPLGIPAIRRRAA
ncbi:phage portal protein [Nitratireductor pacificus]|nr:phage portal protein [Nitratireductor pacificus]